MSSPAVAPLPRYYPLINPVPDKEDEKKDWVKIGGIVAAVVGALIAALGVLCFMGIFPPNLLGGPLQSGITVLVGAVIFAPGAFVAYKRWNSQPS